MITEALKSFVSFGDAVILGFGATCGWGLAHLIFYLVSAMSIGDGTEKKK